MTTEKILELMHEEVLRLIVRAQTVVPREPDETRRLDDSGRGQGTQPRPFLYYHLAQNHDGVVIAMFIEEPQQQSKGSSDREAGEVLAYAPLSKAWAERCCHAMAALPWPEELLKHEVRRGLKCRLRELT